MATTVDTTSLISRDKPASQAMDYSFLREEGISYIQGLASSVWTDYNIHDPGVTILEALAYAITDLSARANQPVKDILASKPGASPTEKDFFSAAEILPCSAVTVNDFRKILIDQDKISNAWLSKSTVSEQTFFVDTINKKLSFTTGDPVSVNGLYNVLLEFEEDPILGDLNSSVIQSPIGVGGIIEAAFPFWDEIPAAWGTNITINTITLEDVTAVPGEKLRPLDSANDHDYFAILDVTYNGTTTDQIPVTIKVTAGIDETTIKNKLVETGPQSLTKEYNQRIIAAVTILNGIKKYLSSNRNTCEDFFAFKTSRVQEIAVTTTLQIASGVDTIQTLAEIFYRLDNFFAPPIPFYSLEQMQARPGITTDDIFEGPLLKNGFIDDNDLEELKRSNIIYTSDLLRLIMSLNDDFNYGNSAFINQRKGIIAVEDLTIANFINNQPLTADVRNCLNLTSTDIYKPKLSIDKSQITVLKDNVPVVYDLAQVKNAFNLIKIARKPARSTASDLEIPAGTNLSVEDYYSIQNDFPLTYGISHAGLPDSASDQRKAQAKQLKGFLVFFEQLLANYLSQLAHVKDLFSINAGVNETYFWQILDTVPDVAPLLKSGYPSSLPALLSQLEQSPTAVSRRNNFLDHLLARFGEDFTDLALLMYSKYGNAATNALITDKSDFLKAYGDIGYNRSKSFDYTDPAPWGTGNVPWLKRRICGLLGIAAYADMDLAGSNVEGFHMIENILLRPKVNDIPAGNVDLFLKVNLQSDADGNIIASTKDPYSFRITFVFPNWPARFADPDFSKYIEKIIQRETPAHILADIHWVAAPAMLSFETAFKAWLAANATPTNETVLTNAKNQFITILNGL